MNRQNSVLTFIYEEYGEDGQPISVDDMFQRYQDKEGYPASKPNLSNILSKLSDKDLVKSPTYGEYSLTDKGEKKADYLLNPDDYYSEKPDGYRELVEELELFLSIEKESEVAKAEFGEIPFRLSLVELSKWSPEIITNWFEEDLQSFREALDEAVENAGNTGEPFSYNIAPDLEEYHETIFKARSGENYGQPVILEGIIEGSTSPMNEIDSATFQCQECGEEVQREQDSSQLNSPYKCDYCSSKKFDVIDQKVIDVIDFSITNPAGENESINARFRPRSLERSIKKAFRPGSKIKILGEVKKRPKGKGNTIQEPYLDVFAYKSQEKELSREIDDEDREKMLQKVQELKQEGRNPYYVFARSLAPEIVEMDDVKEVVSASLIGGSGIRDHGRIHSYIIGNPGTGKSAIQDYIGETFPNSHYADASNATTVGLTATVEETKGGGYRLMAGKLVYADRGILSIDEFDNIKSKEAKRLNRAMANGEFSIDKANQHATLPGRASIIATANYKELLNTEEFIEEFLPEIHESTEDRFSLVFCMPPEDNNKEAVSAITEQYKDKSSSYEGEMTPEEQVIYREMAREKEPALTEEAATFLEKWINGQESISESKSGKPEFKSDSKRYVDSLCKLATMFARSNLKEIAEKEDAEEAVKLLLKCRNSRGIPDGEASK